MRPPPLSRAETAGLAAVTIALLAVRLPFLPVTLEDIDSVNFHLGIHDFYPFAHQPHPPGYAVFIGLAKLLHPLLANHAAALALPSVLCSAFLIWPLYLLVRALTGARAAGVAVVLLAANPIFWMNSVRPMSDITGLFVILAAQAALVIALIDPARRPIQRRLWLIGAALSGLAIGVRPQAVMLVGPILLLGWLRLPRLRLTTLVVTTAAIAVWLVPTITETGGLGRLLSKQNQLLTESLPFESFVSRPTVAKAVDAILDVLVRPWGEVALGVILLGMALVGAALLARSDRPVLGLLAVLFVPYLAYHYCLQYTTALRYSLPVVPLVVTLAAVGLTRASRSLVPGVLVSGVAIGVGAWMTVPALQAYSSQPSPPMQAITYLRSQATSHPPLVASGHDVFERYLADLGDAAQIVRTDPGVEWHGLNRYWAYGGGHSVWFLDDPTRSTLRLIDPDAQTEVATWNWPAPLARLTQGARPTQVRLIRIDPPDWFIESGAFLVGEAADPERVSRGPHLLFVRATPEPQSLSVFGVAPAAMPIDIVVGDDRIPTSVGASSFGINATVPAASGTALEYIPVTLEGPGAFQVTSFTLRPQDEDAVEPTTGFFAPERDEIGEFRWVSPHGDIVIARSGPPVRVRLRGRIPVEFVTMPLELEIEVDGQVVKTEIVRTAEFNLSVDLPAAPKDSSTLVSIAASSSFVPDVFEHNGDTRLLTFRAYDLHAERVGGRSGTASTETVSRPTR